MKTIILQYLHHNRQPQIAIRFEKDATLNLAVRKLKGIKWSQSNQCWYLPLSRENYETICTAVKAAATINNSHLKSWLQKHKAAEATLPPAPTAAAGSTESKKSNPAKKISVNSPVLKLCATNLTALENFVRHLVLKAYSPSTINTYRNELLQLLQLLKNTPVDSLQPDDLKRYMHYAMETEGISENTAHSRLNALKFYFEQVLHRQKFFWEIPRPKKPIQLPGVFGQEEVAAIINSVQNLKHKVMLMMAYSSGLRVSEVVSAKTYHIDSSRMTIFVQAAKGKKDRLVTLSPVLLVMLREYARKYKPAPKGYLFEGATRGEPYASRSLQEVIQAAKKRAGIMKPGSIHALRHSFATHLIERGTDISMIQKLLGHNDIKTTLRYLHTSNKDLLRVISPLDDLNLK